MRVGFGATALARGLAQGGGVDGIGSYTRELLVRLQSMPELALLPYAYAGPMPSNMADSLLLAGDFQRQGLWSMGTGLPFAKMQKALAGRVDLVHATDHFIPKLRGVPVVATLMDAIPLAHPEWVRGRFKRPKNVAWRRSAQWAQHVITISEHSRQEIVQWFGVPEERISVISLGVDGRWFAPPSPAEWARVRQAYGLPETFFLSVGTLQPRKNTERLIAAHRLLPAALRREVPLVVVGKAGWGCDSVVAQLVDGDAGALRWLRYVPDQDMLPLLQQAAALLFPSLHEGFGLPVLEAFAAGVPVMAANTTAVPEVAGDAAVLLNPLDTSGWAEAMQHLLQTPSFAQTLRQQGRERAQRFTWNQTALRTAQVYAGVLSHS